MRVNPSIFRRSLQMWARMAVCFGVFGLFAVEARAVSLSLVKTNITMPAGRTFQMPLTGSDPDGLPLKFSARVSNQKALKTAMAPSSNRSLVFNVSGVDANNQPFTGNLVLQLFEDLTPHTTARIIDLVNSNFYNGLIFQRVIAGFVAQGGGSASDPNFSSGVTFDDEFVKTLIYDGFGQLGMANTGPNDSNDSQFFITDVDLSIDNPTNMSPQSLNFQQPIFGQLTSGFDVFSKIMSTPVGPSQNNSSEISAPLSNVVINTATIISNSQDGVLRLTASATFTGVVNVAVSAANAGNEVATQTLQVKIIPNTNTSPAFLSPVPKSMTVTQNSEVSFIVKTTDIDGEPVSIGIWYAVSEASLTDIVATVEQSTGQIWFRPDLTLTGVVDLVIGAKDLTHNYDTHPFSITYLPRSASPTMAITSLNGIVKDVSKPGGDSVNVSGRFTFIGESDHTFSSNDVLVLMLGDPTTPLTVSFGPDSLGWKFNHGTVNGKARVISGLSSNVSVSAQFNSTSGTFKISVKNFDFPAPIVNQVQIGIALGNDYVTDVRTWVEETPGTFVPLP